MTESFKSRLLSGCRELGIDLSEDQLEKLSDYYHMIIEKNKVMNLTAITEEKDFIDKHFTDSLSIVRAVDLNSKRLNLIDVGTGAGFPGIVLKIAFPDIDILLFDSLKKRLNFLDDVISVLDLRGIRTLHARAEDAGRDRMYREKFDLVVSRAVASMPVLLEYCMPFVKKNGIFAAYKSADCKDEIEISSRTVKLLGGDYFHKTFVKLPGTSIERCLVTVRKISSTPSAYPRKAGRPSASPLI